MMPRMDGIELVRRIRKSEHADCVYTLLLSARSHKEDLVEGMEAGADDFVSKPFDRDELRVRLQEGERIVRLGRELAAQNKALRTLPAGIVPAIRQPLDELALNLTAVRRIVCGAQRHQSLSRDLPATVRFAAGCARGVSPTGRTIGEYQPGWAVGQNR